LREKKKKIHPIPLVGITGGIGSGKTSLAEIFKILGAVVIDADKVGKKVLENNKNVFKKIINEFGKDVIEKENKISRKKLASIVFNDREKLDKLNSIIHPPMIKLIKEEISKEFKLKRNPMIVVDAALIYEAKMEDKFDYIINVCADVKNRMKRTALKNKISKKEVERRINSQILEEIKIKKSHYNIENNGTIEELKINGEVIFNKILKDFYKFVN
jgi:dephospho-CoA kinase